MRVEDLPLAGVKLLYPERHGDERGFFSETYRRRELLRHGIDVEFLQDNHSSTPRVGTVRGLHFQIPPLAQAKLVRVPRGAILDVVVDLRRRSPTFGRHVAVRLSAAEWNQLYVPVGLAHGFCTLEEDTEVLYKVSADYSREHERGLLWNDPALGIRWPVEPAAALVSARDAAFPGIAALPTYFELAAAAGAGGSEP